MGEDAGGAGEGWGMVGVMRGVGVREKMLAVQVRVVVRL